MNLYDMISSKLEEIRFEASKLCGIGDNVSYMLGDDETAECIDRVETNIKSSCDQMEKAMNDYVAAANNWVSVLKLALDEYDKTINPNKEEV